MTDEFHWLPLDAPLSGAAIWQSYSRTHRVDLSATAIVAEGALYFFDPIPLAEDAFEELLARGKPAAVYLSSGNHERAAADYARRFNIPIHAHAEAIPEFTSEEAKGAHPFTDGAHLPGGFHAMSLPGGPEGETAFYHEGNGGCLILGDALINLGSTDFTLLPDKYCLKPAELRRSLRLLEQLPLEKLFFAHGLPITRKAKERLAALLSGE